MSRRGNAVAVSTICAVTFGIFFAIGTVPSLLHVPPTEHLADPHASASGTTTPQPAPTVPGSSARPRKRKPTGDPALPTDPELNAAATQPQQSADTTHSHAGSTHAGTGATGGKTTTGSGTETEDSPSAAPLSPSPRGGSPTPSERAPSGTPTPHLDQASPSASSSAVSPPTRHVPFLRWLYHMVRSVV